MDRDFMEQMLNEHISACVNCGNSRKRLSFKDLPAETKIEFEADANVDVEDIEYCLYCSNCDKYSIICGGGSSFDDDESSAPPKFSGNPARNAPCPCGSGKKYKRCCEK